MRQIRALMPHWLASSRMTSSALMAMPMGERFGRVGVAHFPHNPPLMCIGSKLAPKGSQTGGADFAHERRVIRLVLMRSPIAIAT